MGEMDGVWVPSREVNERAEVTRLTREADLYAHAREEGRSHAF